MYMSMGLTQSLRQEQKVVLSQQIVHNKINWSLVDAIKAEPPKFDLPKKKATADTLAQLLEIIDAANELFRYDYAAEETTVQTKKGTRKEYAYFKVPLMRDYNIEIENIRIPITRKEYQEAMFVIDSVGRFERIARAIPYGKIRQTVEEHCRREHITLDDLVIVGVDRGGRIPTMITRHALGHPQAHYLKVDQGGGRIDEERLDILTQKNILKGKHILFIDSTVDSGRQIRALERYFDNPDQRNAIGHTGWTVMGSCEYGDNPPRNGTNWNRHLNVNWGVDPDETFEDNPELMGVDYGNSHNKIVACPSATSFEIRRRLLEVPAGYIIDMNQLLMRHSTPKRERALSYRDVASKKYHIQEPSLASLDQSGIPQRLILAVSGSSKTYQSTPTYVHDVGLVLGKYFDIRAGTTRGTLSPFIDGARKAGANIEIVDAGQQTNNADYYLALEGRKGTLDEIKQALRCAIPLVVFSKGPAGMMLSLDHSLADNGRLYIESNLRDAADVLIRYAKSKH